MKNIKWYISLFFLLFATTLYSQNNKKSSGNLFIIGGGDRTETLMKALMRTVQLSADDYIVVLPMSSEEPDSSYLYFKWDMELYCKNTIANLNFTYGNVHDQKMLDSLLHAKLIFITGGDQNRFMQVVLNTPVYTAIHDAYKNGSTIAGTSAGAAVMGKYMITGNQLLDTTYYSTFYSIVDNNIEFKEGLGLVENVIVDQHFVVRSRYNRLFSAMEEYPKLICAGIDESTALVIHGKTATIAGESQVVYLKNKGKINRGVNGYLRFTNVKVKIFLPGDSFKIK